jgi:hypothetical protein
LKYFLLAIVINFLFLNNLLSMSEDYEKRLYRGCYPTSKQYLGAEKANEYCSCTVKTLSDKFSDEDMDELSKQNEDTQLKAYNFASEFCANSLKLN